MPQPPPTPNPQPIQFTSFTKKDFESDIGINRLNVLLSQYTPIINGLLGASGPTLLPSGVDVQGAKVTGLAAPTSPSDAISSGHASSNYGAQAQQPQLDIGGKYALKGLTAAYQTGQQNSAAITKLQSAIPSASYVGGGSITLAGLLIQFGFVTNMDTAVFPMNFPVPFPHACQSLVAATTGPTDRITYIVSFNLTQFTLANNGTGAGATWIAMGW